MTYHRLSRASKEELLSLLDATSSKDIPSGKLSMLVDVWVTKGWAERLELPRGRAGWRLTANGRAVANGRVH